MPSKKCLVTPWIFFIPLFALIVWRLVDFHCFPDPRVESRARKQYGAPDSTRGDRGLIFDRRSALLAASAPVSAFALDPQVWSPLDAPKLKGLIPEELVEKISKPFEEPYRDKQYFPLVRWTTPEVAQKILDLKLRGLFKEKEKKREYYNGSLLSHVLGFCNVDEKGQAGIELAWNSLLNATDDHKILIRRSGGRSLSDGIGGEGAQRYIGSRNSVVTLTVDSRIQYIVEKYLDKAAAEHKAKWGAAVCIDPNTGAVLSMASWPAFNPNRRAEIVGEKNAKRIVNNVVSRVYEPGSTFKPIFMGIALEEGLVRTNEVFQCPYRLKVADGFITEAYPKAMGNISTAEILIKSSNVGMAQIGKRSKPVTMYRNLLDWGFGKAGDLELEGVAKGLLASPGQWRGVVPANISIGQGLATTPLQLVMAMAPVVNGGEFLSPYIVEEAVNSRGEVIYRGGKTVIREVLTSENSHWLRKAMRDVVLTGTGKSVNTPAAELAAKTGTAQVAERGKYVKGRYTSSLIGFWPYENPQYLMLLVIGEPTGGKYYGAEVTGPAFRNIVEEIAALEDPGIQRQEPQPPMQFNAARPPEPARQGM